MIELLKFFLYLGATGFGGPLMLIQLMREQYVERQKFMTANDFDQTFTLIKAMPGPIAFQMASYIGHKKNGVFGAFVAGGALLLPAFLMMVVIGFYYDSFVKFQSVDFVLHGFLFSVTAVIFLSLKSLVLSQYKSIYFLPIVVASFVLANQNILPEPVLILGSALLVILLTSKVGNYNFLSVAFLAVDYEKLVPFFKICLYGGAFVFGTGFALMPFFKTQLVDINQWITIKQFNDAVIFGQMTPGPVTITGVLLGYQVSGFIGAITAVIGIFLMPFFHIVTWFPKAVGWLSKQKWISGFMLGATAAVVGSILNTLYVMNTDSFNKPMFWVLFLLTFIIVLKKPKWSVVGLVFVCGLLNLIYFTAINAV